MRKELIKILFLIFMISFLSVLFSHTTLAKSSEMIEKDIKITVVDTKGHKKTKKKVIKIEKNNKNKFKETQCSLTKYAVPKNSGFKSYLRYSQITNPSRQLDLQNVATTDEHGFRTVNGRYCIAVGTYFNAPVGTYVDLRLKNGVRIKCIVGDIKADKDTDKRNIFTRNGCCSEFIVDEKELPDNTRSKGNMSFINRKWGSPVQYIYVYDYNVKPKTDS